MKGIAVIGSALAMLLLPAHTFAQHIKPSDTNVVFEGYLGLNSAVCNITMPGTTGPNLGAGAHWQHATSIDLDPGTLTGLPCTRYTLVASDFVIDSFNPTGGAAGLGSITGTLNNAEIKDGIPTICSSSAPLPIYGENISILPDEVYVIFSGTLGACTVSGDLEASGVRFVH